MKTKSKMKFTNPRFDYVRMLHDARMNQSEFSELMETSPQSISQMLNRGTITYRFMRKVEAKLKKQLSSYILTSNSRYKIKS